MQQQLIDQVKKVAKQRRELVWVEGSPLQKAYATLACDLCSKDTKEATCMSTGYSWRSGWVFLCKDCHLNLKYWHEEEEKLQQEYDHYRVMVS